MQLPRRARYRPCSTWRPASAGSAGRPVEVSSRVPIQYRAAIAARHASSSASTDILMMRFMPALLLLILAAAFGGQGRRAGRVWHIGLDDRLRRQPRRKRADILGRQLTGDIGHAVRLGGAAQPVLPTADLRADVVARQAQQTGYRRRLAAERGARSEEHTSELQSRENLVCRLLLDK